MSGLRQILFVLGLGAFWAVSPSLSKLAGAAGLGVGQIVVTSGLCVGIALLALQRVVHGRLGIGWPQVLYGLGCGALTLMPFALGQFAIRHVSVALMAVITSTSPLWTYALALTLARDRFNLLRVLALALGLGSSLVLILTRPGASLGGVDVWVLATLALPVLWGIYNNFTAMTWPKGMTALTGGMVESTSSGLLALPLLALMDWPTRGAMALSNTAYWLLAAMILAWVVERICFFSMIEHLGPVTTVQATYVATPGAVLLGVLLFAETPDAWLWVSLALLAAALWLNARATQTSEAPQSLASKQEPGVEAQ